MGYLKITPLVEKSKAEELQFGDIVFHTNGMEMTIQTEKVLKTKDDNITEYKLPTEFIYAELTLSKVREIHAFLGAYIAQEDYNIKEFTKDNLDCLDDTIGQAARLIAAAIEEHR